MSVCCCEFKKNNTNKIQKNNMTTDNGNINSKRAVLKLLDEM